MRHYTVNKFKHTVYEDDTEVPPNLIVKEDWRTSNIGDWVRADDDCIIQILRKGKMLRKKGTRYYVGTCTGTFLVLPKTKMDTDRRSNIYSFGGHETPEEVVKNRKELTANEELFVKFMAIDKDMPEEAYVKAFPTNNKRYARIKAANLLQTERIRTRMKEDLKPTLDELGIDDRMVLSGIKEEAVNAEKSDTRLKALFKLSDILDLEEKTTTKVQQVTGAVFQGFTDDMIEPVEKLKEISDGK
tara:strand:- start:6853 stop:7584 length:732 start_codon:yes stop_codon:yes gene_type:complete